MALSQAEQQRVQSWLNTRGRQHSCPVCGANNWSIGDVVSAPIYTNGGVQLGGPSVPMVQLVCSNCVYVRLFAAKPIGLVS